MRAERDKERERERKRKKKASPVRRVMKLTLRLRLRLLPDHPLGQQSRTIKPRRLTQFRLHLSQDLTPRTRVAQTAVQFRLEDLRDEVVGFVGCWWIGGIELGGGGEEELREVGLFGCGEVIRREVERRFWRRLGCRCRSVVGGGGGKQVGIGLCRCRCRC